MLSLETVCLQLEVMEKPEKVRRIFRLSHNLGGGEGMVSKQVRWSRWGWKRASHEFSASSFDLRGTDAAYGLSVSFAGKKNLASFFRG